jgi:hypothetical protein
MEIQLDVNSVTLYRSIAPHFSAASSDAIDIQSDFAERLQVVAAITGGKPVFMAVVEDEPRRRLFEKVTTTLASNARYGFRDADIHHRYRPLRISNSRLADAFEVRSRETLPVVWIGDSEAADIYEFGNPASAGDDLTLGYPRCCAEWHYDCFFARGPEAFAEVTDIEGEQGAVEFVIEKWRPRPGFFLPRTPLTAAVLRGNMRYPFIDHVACPECLADQDSPTARLDAEYSALADAVDARTADEVREWCSRLDRRIVALKAEFGAERTYMKQKMASTMRSRDAYDKHSRHQLKALGF